MAGIATASKTASRVQRNRNANYGTQIDQLGGIQVGTSIVLVNLETDRRFHNIRFQVTAVYASGGTALTATKLTGIGTGLKVNVTVNATGIVTGIVLNA